jgi:hypothetical protein
MVVAAAMECLSLPIVDMVAIREQALPPVLSLFVTSINNGSLFQIWGD